MPDTPLTEKTGRAILSELQSIRRNQEAQMPSGMVEQTRMQRVPVQEESKADPQSPTAQARVNDKLANLKTKGG